MMLAIPSLLAGGMAAYAFHKTNELLAEAARTGSYPRGCSSRMPVALEFPCPHVYCQLLRNARESATRRRAREERRVDQANDAIYDLHYQPGSYEQKKVKEER